MVADTVVPTNQNLAYNFGPKHLLKNLSTALVLRLLSSDCDFTPTSGGQVIAGILTFHSAKPS